MKVILIDDEQLALNYLEYQLLEITSFKIVGKYTEPLLGKEAIEQNEVDLVFLDIQMPEFNGLELAEQLLKVKPELQIVFVTAYDKYALRAFELNALDYILKPVSKQRLLNTVNRIQHRELHGKSSLFKKKKNGLQLNLFHQLTLSVAGEERIIPLRWRTAKVKQLFLYLLQHRGQVVSKVFLIELLWPEIEPQRAYQQLYTAVYHIRQTLGEYSHYFKISSSPEGYTLLLERVNLDVEQFEQFIHSRPSLSAETIGDYEEALAIFKGDYLQGHDYIWVESERQRLQVHWVQTALKIATWYYYQDELDKAMTLCLEICQRYPLEEEAYLLLMKIFADKGMSAAVHQQYHHLQEILLSELHEQPSSFTTKWYQQWKEIKAIQLQEAVPKPNS